MGNVTLALAKMFAKPKFVVQDVPPVIEGAKTARINHWQFKSIDNSRLICAEFSSSGKLIIQRQLQTDK
jgi:hypothetical protein